MLIYKAMEKSERKKDYDVIICGGGAAGISAALWCDDLKLDALVLEANGELGGQLLWTHNRIDNHLGTLGARDGRELRDLFAEQIARRKFDLKLSSEISDIDFDRKIVALENGEKFMARFLIVAAGVRRRRLNVAGEDEFTGKGIIESGARDPNAVENKRAVIVGGGDAAFENALILAEKAAKIYLINRGKKFRARAEFAERVSSNPKIEVLNEIVVREIKGNEFLETVRLENLRTKETFDLAADALLIRIGIEPNTEIVRGKLDLDERGFIEINSLCETSVAGVFAVGDVANPLAPTVSGAVGMGATAVKVISEKLKASELY